MTPDEQPPVTITVNGERWMASRSLADCGPESRVFTARVTPEGTVVTFGDGVHGKVPPFGARIVLAITPDTPAPVSLHRTASPPTSDQPLWTVIRRRADATEFEFSPPCPDPGERGERDRDGSGRAAHWRKVALLLAVTLLALAVWCVWMRSA